MGELAKIERPKETDEIQDLHSEIGACIRKLSRLQAKPSCAWLAGEVGQVAMAELSRAMGNIGNMQYHSMCPKCGGQKCYFCLRTGWVPYHRAQEWEDAIG